MYRGVLEEKKKKDSRVWDGGSSKIRGGNWNARSLFGGVPKGLGEASVADGRGIRKYRIVKKLKRAAERLRTKFSKKKLNGDSRLTPPGITRSLWGALSEIKALPRN